MDSNFNDYSDYSDKNEEYMENINKYGEVNEVEDEIRIEDDNKNLENDDIDETKLDYLKSNKSWFDLNIDKELVEKLISKGFRKPSKIQSTVISFFSKNINKDLIVQSQNGSGKTLSFLVPSIECVLRNKKFDNNNNNEETLAPQVIILADTKELTYQIFKILLNIKVKKIRVDLQHPENQELRKDSNIIVCTLGRLSYLLYKKILSTKNLDLFVIDEADKLLESDSNKSKLPKIFNYFSNDVKIGIFSATMPNGCINFLEKLKRNVVKIILKDKQELSLNNISHFFIKSQIQDKLNLVNKLLFLWTDGSVIIFLNTKKFAEKFGIGLSKSGHKVEILLGDMDANTRLKILNEFKNGKIRILVSTNLISRGIDNRKVGLVINVDLPFLYNKNRKQQILDIDTYIHRVGRTGRFGDSGIALNLIEDENLRQQLINLKKNFNIDMKEIGYDNLEELKVKITKNSNYNLKKRKLLEENI